MNFKLNQHQANCNFEAFCSFHIFAEKDEPQPQAVSELGLSLTCMHSPPMNICSKATEKKE